MDLEILWNGLLMIVDEGAFAIVRTSMSKVVVEGRDFGAMLYDPRGNLLAADISIASKTGATSIVVKELLEHFPPETLAPGDVLASNNPWWIMGHLNDIAIVCPIFNGRKLVAFAECIAHMGDIGGSLSGAPREVYEEGLIIPPLKIGTRAGENETFFSMLQANVRIPGHVAGDVRALIAGCRVMEERVAAFLERHGMTDLSRIGGTVLERSERTMRAAIAAAIPNGVYRGSTTVDALGEVLTIAVKATAKDGRLEFDFDGSSPQSLLGINSTLVYTGVWCKYITKCLVCPELPNNEGTFAPITVKAPVGTFVNPTFPAPVKMKPSTGHYIPTAIVNALADVVPDRILAESGNKFLVYLSGRDEAGAAFSDMMFVMGGMGARANKDGLHCMSFPANSSNLPVEVLEASIPVRVRHKRLRTDSGGAGRFRGGCGQEFEFESVSATPMTVRAEHGKLYTTPLGLRGGKAGASGGIAVNGSAVADKSAVALARGDVMNLQTPGSGGAYPPGERDPAALERDVENGIVSARSAGADYR
ncbi:MAG: hydantoinase B/oxoprolinase family protein [Candidatus Eremiobacteraeota bacterium]|nr:hydantoinase B/oxoprolinase family protein [Candidatus Eremiobacteraeota bacterium]